MSKVKELAKIIAQIHSYEYFPFYNRGNSSQENIWEELSDYSNDPEVLDRSFFIDVSKSIINFLKNNPENSLEEFSLILSRIHSHTLVPFYLRKAPSYTSDFPGWDGYYWDKLVEKTYNNGDVDKEFFKGMADAVLKKINKMTDP